MSAVAPAISSVYSVPSEWISLKPAMILFNRFTHENRQNIYFLENTDLEKELKTYNEAAEIISKYLSNSPDLLRKYPEISEAFREINSGIITAKRLHEREINQRKEREEEQRQQRLREEERERQEAAIKKEYVQQERIKRGLRYGEPPINSYSCPAQFPIRATANLDESDSRGIYYYSNERAGVEVFWCFSSEEEAKAENFRRPHKTPPKYQPR
ncbi:MULTISPECIES: hypothetical protein [unclassified Microcoleus]|uniref:hypothetical protein n=1 Tax=unclassified Microcoleus TaxID=2642155 RepID=UPI002FCFFD5B